MNTDIHNEHQHNHADKQTNTRPRSSCTANRPFWSALYDILCSVKSHSAADGAITPYSQTDGTGIWSVYPVCVRVHLKIWQHRDILYLHHIHWLPFLWSTGTISRCLCLTPCGSVPLFVVWYYSRFAASRNNKIPFFLCCIFQCSLCIIRKRFSLHFMVNPQW